ncbi:OmpA family protein [Hyunsoonleella sp. SJ7]|uniref:OmpA family protein n=1 Tax=Hyunsoonleella aquatilis TaxID=2762758 RepID=A0A923KI15_9FLAO|nr:DUF5723 family protein [Hyunsoonleella aquatilis]MBC3757734.1 OmpA family protein [Hyunsoonleella aquatilis]
MKKTTFLLFFILLSCFIEAQSFIGYLSDNYSGVHGIISNPSNIADSRLKLDINLAGVSGFGANDYYGINIFDAFKDTYSFNTDPKKSPTNDNNGLGNIDVLGPSVMFSLSEKSSIAVFTRGRLFINANELNGNSIESLDDEDVVDFNINEGNFDFLANAWAEVGITYARVIWDDRQNFLKGGASIKYLKGMGSIYGVGNNVTINYDEDGTDLGGGQTTGSISSTGFINYGRFDEFDNDNYEYEVPDNASGFAFDVGFVYEWRPDYYDYRSGGAFKNERALNKYKLKLGLSITDIGSINYKDGIKEGYNITNTGVSEDEFDNADDIGDFLNNFYTQTDAGVGYDVDLPTALHFNADYNFNGKFYLNLNTDFSVMKKSRKTANRVANNVSLTPRYESKWFGFYLPLTVVEDSGFRIGAGLRAGPLYLGSGSIISAFASDNNRQADVYAGLKIPFFHKDSKDKDGDGILDKYDDCPSKPGPVENNGCPWGDKDKDDVLDNEDKCPDEKGPAENNGCPWTDTDGDGIPDKDDVCVNTPGDAENNGCPKKVIEKVQKDLNEYAKVILFDYGTPVINQESYDVLNDIIKILKEYPNARFMIEGHTDSTSSSGWNQRLSENRANSVLKFLVDNGVDPSRLTAKGYGETKPIAPNDTKEGRALNRRVEINLIKSN